jgi:hypothetical protein
MHFFPFQWFFVQRFGHIVSRVLPGRNVGVVFVVAQCFAFGRLVLFAEVTAARLVAMQRVLRSNSPNSR